jgi:hypothetical protein
MKRNLKILMFLLVAIFLLAGTSFALELGTKITISDNRSNGTGWYGEQEDQEVEPNMQATQAWDLEGFFLNGTMLTMVGGFDFKDGHPNYPAYTSGDIFIDTDNDASYGNGAIAGADKLYGYDYVFDLDFNKLEYSVYQLTSNSILLDVLESYNQPYSNPWKYSSGGIYKGTGALIYTDFNILTDAVTGFSGGLHDAVTVDLSFLAPNTTFTSHFTMGCGNDNLMGSGTTSVPEPTPMLLLGGALIGLAGIGRRKFFKSK